MISESTRSLIRDIVGIVIAVATAVITYLLFTTDRDHARDEHRRAAVDFLLRLEAVMDETPTTRPCMRYILLNSKMARNNPSSDHSKNSGDMLIDLIINDRSVELPESDDEMKSEKAACLGGLRSKPTMPGAEYTYIRQEVLKYLNVIDVASSFALLAPDFECLKMKMNETDNRDPDLLLMKEIESVITDDDKKFIWAWWERIPKKADTM
jgi:hypothetical protein